MPALKTRIHVLAVALLALAPARAADPVIEALQLYRGGRCSQAEPLLRDVVARQPKDVSARKLLAACLVQLHRPEEANAEYRQVVKIAPGDADAIRALQPPPVAPVHPVAQAKPQAPEAADRVRAGAPLDQAEKLIVAGKLDEAEQILTSLVSRAPDLMIPRQRLAEIYTRQNAYGKSAAEYAVLAEKHPGNPVFLLRAAQNFSWQRDYEAAADHFRRYLLEKPGDRAAQLSLAGVLLWGDHAADAAEIYRSYLDHNPQDVDARLNLGNALLWSKQFDQASGQFQRVLEQRPDDGEAQYGLGQCYEHAAHLELALKAYQRAAELNPQDEKLAAARARVAEALPQHRGFEHLEKKDYRSAADSFLEYLKQHPDSTETMLEVARVYSWGKVYPQAIRYYRQYLDHVPNDETALREAAKTELAIPDFAQAQADYSKIAAGGHATADDYESLVHAFVWDDKLEEAQPFAERLVALSPGNPAALEARKLYRDRARLKTYEAAEKLTTEGRLQEALSLYRSYADKFGTDRETDLSICRLYNWSKQYATAERGYLEYLARYGDDPQARLEFADVQKWSGEYTAAEGSYRAVLARDSGNPMALMGLAQVADYRGADRFAVVKAYRRALVEDASNTAAQERLEELGPQVYPSLAYHQNSFSDSDHFSSSVNRFEGAFPMRGGLKLMPFFGYDYFSQDLQVGGTACGTKETNASLKALDNLICGANGTVHGAGAGGRIELMPGSHFSLSVEAYQAHFDNNHNSTQYRADAVFGGSGRALTLSVMQRDAAYDVNTVASLFEAVRGRHAFISYQQPLSDRWRLWVMGGLSDYSRTADGISPGSTQRRFGARLDFTVNPEFTVGYYARGTGFTQASPLFFSPSYYGTYGFAYAWRKPLAPKLRLRLDGELGYGRIDRFSNPSVSTLEVMLYPGIEWRIRPDLSLVLGYRYGRGRTSAFGSPAYSSSAIDFRLEGSFMPPVNHSNPARLDLH